MAEKVVRRPPGGPGNRMNVVEHSKDIKKAYRNFFSYMGSHKWSMAVAGILSLAGSVLNLIGPSKLSDMTNLITKGLAGSVDIPTILKICITLAVLYSMGLLFNYFQGFIMATVSQKITKNMRTDISEKIKRLPLKYFDTNSTGDVLSRVTNDVDTVERSMNMSFSTLVSSVAMLIGSLAMMLLTNVIMAVSGVVSALIGFFLMITIIKKSQVYFKRQQKELGDLNGHIEETYSGHDVIKAFNGENAERETFHKLNEKLYDSAWKSQFCAGMIMPLMHFIGNLAYVVVCVVGAVLAVNNSITFGTIVAFMLYIRLFTQPLQNISQASGSIQSVGAACERVFEFLEEEEMTPENEKTEFLDPDNIRGEIDFEHVKFGYKPEKVIIHDFTHKALPGQKIAIVGPTGAGKTTLVNLLMRFYELNGGMISVDGKSIASLTRENVHDLFGMVLQDTWLFEGTLRENLVYGKENVSDEKLDEICEMCSLSQWVDQLPFGYDTVLGDSVSMSAGQKQLITIARAMIENAPLLILDEATSSVDTRTEMAVQRAMDKLTHGRTSFVIAHRLSTIRNADCILVINDGDVIESGTHDELIKAGGFYSKLYNSQFENDE